MSTGHTMLTGRHSCFTAEIAKSAEKILVLCVLCVLCGFFRGVAVAAPPVRTMYTEAVGREQTVRAALAAPEAALAVLTDVRAVVADYEAVVRHYPASGYSDNALWQAGRLLLDAFTRFGQPGDREAGVRILRRLAATYPTSKLVQQVPDLIARADAIGGHTGPPLQPTTGVGADPRVSPIGLATIKDIRRVVMPGAVRVTIELDNEVPFHEERLPDPARVFVDFSGTRAAPSLVDQTLRFESDADIVRQIRVGRHPNNTTRIVLDAAGVINYSVYPLYSPYRLVIDCVRVPAAATTPEQPAGVARQTVEGARASSPVASQSTDSTSAAVGPPEHNATGGLSIARQLGLGVSRIVIDPGHGGHDPGAKGKGVTEAELVLDVALRLEKLLRKVPGVEVILTRRTDEFIPLPERTAFANREGADLFLSIHANASTNVQAHGIETYFLNFANNQSAAAVAARENASSTQAMGGLPDFVKAIALNNKLDESRDFALHVQRAMVERQKAANRAPKDLGVKQAPFVVLIGANMPSVLAEMGFVTNAQEAKLLKGNAYRQRVAESLLNAIRKYQTSLKNVSTVARK